MATLKPFRDYDEKDVINLYSFNLLTGKNDDSAWTLGSDWDGRIAAGHIVAVAGDGWNNGQNLDMIADAGPASSSLKNVTTQRYGVTAKVESAGGALIPLGMTLHHVAQYDENGELLKFNPRKASELEAVIDGQAVPVVTRGMFLVNGIDYTNQALDTAYLAAGGKLYADADGGIGTDSGLGAVIGRAMGLADSNDNVLIKLEL